MQENPSARAFEQALERGRTGEITIGTARTLFRGAASTRHARELFAAASEVRDRRLGRRLSLTAHIHMVTECKISPSCNYCSLSSSRESVSRERTRLTEREVLRSVRYASERGVDSIVLVGGTNLEGSDDEVRRLVESVRQTTTTPLALDIGPSLSDRTLRWLKAQEVRTIYCSVETVSPSAFSRAKPGDSLSARLEFMDRVDRLGLDLGNVVMNGLGRPDDLLRSLLHSRRYRHLRYLHLSTFQPVPGTPWARRRAGSLATSLKALAIARLAFPGAHLGLAEVGVEDPRSVARGPGQLEAGGGNTIAGLLIYKYGRIDLLDTIRERAASLGFETSRGRAG